LIALGALIFSTASWFALAPTPRTDARGQPLGNGPALPPTMAATSIPQTAADVAPLQR